MRVFLTGATGFIGKAVVRELLAAGHQVLGLTRSKQGADSLAAAGVEAHLGDIEDLNSLQRGADLADAVIHTAFNHDFSTFVANCERDRQAIEAMGAVLEGSQRPLIITSSVGMGAIGANTLAVEDYFNSAHSNPRKASELAGIAVTERGGNVSVVRLSQVHDTVMQGLITPLIELAQQKGVSAYVDKGQNRWPAVHINDAARLYILALEKNVAGSRYHAVAEEGISMHIIAETIGRILKVPVISIPANEAPAHFGWLSVFANHDMSASSALTQMRLAWQPTGPSLIADLEKMRV
ncbi:SDR family oxidoreductase [Yersinia kristensenii]|uniref:SDR family oxidoreductase n=1 Tax=Yersinia kristensenii TaxID=28152 RepID=UPI000B671E7D|nr:SDR family oxidoreductase [Yersinia kristensenii]MBW5813997.1 SDR family oxidoreductase [Yersinia kristensenii]MBW5817743.1 SDR family oxidoreductase [Yersinia kristensenii]MBW5826867.1 SDR family oxidoreductase [Yersinia kristensenii]MBW5831185.1 SDR family oxidoreductase [Yersinia kristensenii]MBW5843578.1 SDR family oxidoreductase [Yersinia kristensenii]